MAKRRESRLGGGTWIVEQIGTVRNGNDSWHQARAAEIRGSGRYLSSRRNGYWVGSAQTAAWTHPARYVCIRRPPSLSTAAYTGPLGSPVRPGR